GHAHPPPAGGAHARRRDARRPAGPRPARLSERRGAPRPTGPRPLPVEGRPGPLSAAAALWVPPLRGRRVVILEITGGPRRARRVPPLLGGLVVILLITVLLRSVPRFREYDAMAPAA